VVVSVAAAFVVAVSVLAALAVIAVIAVIAVRAVLTAGEAGDRFQYNLKRRCLCIMQGHFLVV